METSASTPPVTYQRLLCRYFYSGWAFLMPYLFAYLLYYVTKWPVNAAASAAAGSGPEVIGNGIPSPLALTPSPIPCLLHVYWALHAIHVILAGVALWSWLRAQSRGVISDKCSEVDTTYRLPLKPYHSQYPSLLLSLAPWALLALLFYIPGVYLEWPSDPWEHLRRINEWRILDTVGAHSSWMKSSYFIPYSLLSWCMGLRQLFWLDFYYTGICLLLCWQYYRLARACGLGERTSMVFVILQALLFGNNIFSFYRYYGISSSIYAQLGAVALTRIALEFASRGTKLDPILQEEAERTESGSASALLPQLALVKTNAENAISQKIANNPKDEYTPLAHGSNSALQPFTIPSLTPYPCLKCQVLPLITSVLCLTALTAFNHVQGIGIAGLGIAAVIVWRLIEWKRSTLWWLIAGTLVVNALFLWLYPRPTIIETYRAQGYLNAWYGFNILDLTSPAGDRMMQIVSAFGLVNLAAALVLLRRNQVVTWLTITPFLALLLPCFSIPFATALSRHSNDITNIITFQRLLFAIPLELALICLGSHLFSRPAMGGTYAERQPRGIFFAATTCLVLAALAIVPSSDRSYNRVWNANVVVPDDLQLRDIFSKYEAIKCQLPSSPESKIIIPQTGISLVASYAINMIGQSQSRMIGQPSVESIGAALDFLSFYPKTSTQDETDIAPRHPLLSQTKQAEKVDTVQHLNLIADPAASNPAAWIDLVGTHPEFTSGISGLPTISTALHNPVGSTSYVFTAAMIPVQSIKSYRLEMTIRQVKTTGAIVYLAVAWYDKENRLLESNIAQPQGAGNPRGWSNGTYSYFGLASQVPSTSWTTFGISFGLGETAAIPLHAHYVRVGALLNYNAAPSAVVQLTNVRLFEKTTPTLVLAMPAATSTYSPISQAAQLSTHWPPQQVMVDHGGTKEIQAAAERIQLFRQKASVKQ